VIHKFVFRLGADLVLLTMTLIYLAVVVVGTVVAPVVLLGMWIHELVFRKERRIIDEFVMGMQRRRAMGRHCCEECRLKNVRHEEER
jgi:hypothetical protein